MKVAVKDANIFIDLELSGTMDLWLQLEIPTLTTNFITNQLRRGDHVLSVSYIESGAITESSLTFEQLVEMDRLYQKYDGIDPNDASVLLLAKETGAMLLTGDQKLRSSAEAELVEVHGTIWIFDQLVKSGKLCGSIAAEKMTYLINLTGENNRHLPQELCEEFIEKWKTSASG